MPVSCLQETYKAFFTRDRVTPTKPTVHAGAGAIMGDRSELSYRDTELPCKHNTREPRSEHHQPLLVLSKRATALQDALDRPRMFIRRHTPAPFSLSTALGEHQGLEKRGRPASNRLQGEHGLRTHKARISRTPPTRPYPGRFRIPHPLLMPEPVNLSSRCKSGRRSRYKQFAPGGFEALALSSAMARGMARAPHTKVSGKGWLLAYPCHAITWAQA